MKTLSTLLQQGHPSAGLGAPEAFVLMTLAFFSGMVLAVIVSAWILYRRANRPPPHVQLLMEMDEEAERSSKAVLRATHSPWQREADWWKSEDDQSAKL